MVTPGSTPGPRPQVPETTGPRPQDVEARLAEVLARDVQTLLEEALQLEEAYRILNDALA